MPVLFWMTFVTHSHICSFPHGNKIEIYPIWIYILMFAQKPHRVKKNPFTHNIFGRKQFSKMMQCGMYTWKHD